MTSERIPAYGGIAFPREMLETVAESIRTGGIPLHVEHDRSKPIRSRSSDAFVRTRTDGIDELRFSIEVHPDDAHWFETRSGMSTTVTVPLDRPEGFAHPANPTLRLSADHAWFADETLLGAEAAFIAGGMEANSIYAERAYQFSFTPDPQIFVDISLGVLSSLGASGIWAAIAHVFRRRRTPDGGNPSQQTTINLTVKDGNRSVTAVIRTNDEAVANRAINKVDALGQRMLGGASTSGTANVTSAARDVVVWDDGAGKWIPPA